MVESRWIVHRFSRAIHKLGGVIMKWTSEITNDPERDYSLIIELLADEQYVGRLFYEQETLKLKIYQCKEPLFVPVEWLKTVIDKAQAELKN